MALRDLLINRILQGLITIFVVLIIDFALFNLLPGSYVDLLSRNPNLNPQALQKMIEQFGLNKPLPEQFGIFLENFVGYIIDSFLQIFHLRLRMFLEPLVGLLNSFFNLFHILNINVNIDINYNFSLGYSLRYPGTDIGSLILNRLINTLVLILPADIVAIILGIWIGKQSAWRRGTISDVLGWSLALITYAIPAFWLGMTFLSIFGYNMHLFPTDPFNFVDSISDPRFQGKPIEFLINAIAHIALPFIVLVIAFTGVFALIMRNSLLETLSEDYINTAKAKGMKENDQLNKEATPNARIPVSTVIALQIGFSVVGVLLIEIVFNYHGIGRFIWDEIGYRDYPVLQATFFLFTVVIIVSNIVADFIYFYLDPRIRISGLEVKEAKEYSKRGMKRTYFFEFFLILIILSIFLIRQLSFLSAFGLFNSIIAIIVLSYTILNNKYSIKLPNPNVIIFISIFINLIGLFEKYQDFAIAFTLFNLLILVIIEKDIVIYSIKNFVKNYNKTNFFYSWQYNKSQSLTNNSFIILLTIIIVYVILEIVNFLSDFLLQQLKIDITNFVFILTDLISSITPIFLVLAVIAIIGIITGMIISNRSTLRSTLGLLLESNKGIIGLILILFFFILAIFADIIAPYNPSKIGTGSLYQKPMTIGEDQFTLIIIGIAFLLFPILMNSYLKFKEDLDLLTGVKIFFVSQMFIYTLIEIVRFLVNSVLGKQLIDASVFSNLFIFTIFICITSILGLFIDFFWKNKISHFKFIALIISELVSLYFLLNSTFSFINLVKLLLLNRLFTAFTFLILYLLSLIVVGVLTFIWINNRIKIYSMIHDINFDEIKIPTELKQFIVGLLAIYISILLINLYLIKSSSSNLSLTINFLCFIGILLGSSTIFYLDFRKDKNNTSINERRISLKQNFIILLFLVFLSIIGINIFYSVNFSNLTIQIALIILIFSSIVTINGNIQIINRFDLVIYRKAKIKIISFLLMCLGVFLLITAGFNIISFGYATIHAGKSYNLFGTSQLGHDIFSQIIVGVRITLIIGLLATFISLLIGTAIGISSGYYGGMIDSFLMRFTDLFFVIPAFVLMIIIAAIVGPSLETMLIVIGVFSWATTARIVRAQTLSIKERPYVERVKSIGGGDFYIMYRHILPGVLPVIIAQTILLIINSIFFEIGLDFVGLGDPNQISWGSMLYLANQQGAITLNLYWLIYPPGIAVVILLLGFAFLGFSFDEVTNPKLRSS